MSGTVNGSNKAEAQKFVNWLYTPAAQTIWAQNGFRPVDPTVAKRFTAQFPPRPQLFKIGFVGGWDQVNTKFFDPTNGIVAKAFGRDDSVADMALQPDGKIVLAGDTTPPPHDSFTATDFLVMRPDSVALIFV